MESRIVSRGAMLIVGRAMGPVDGQDAETIRAFWERFRARRAERAIRGAVAPAVAYGLITDRDRETGAFTYGIGYEVNPGAPRQRNFDAFAIPARTYAVFTARGSTANGELFRSIRAVWRETVRRWLAENGAWDHDDGPDFERYDRRRFSPSAGACDIYVSVRRAEGGARRAR